MTNEEVRERLLWSLDQKIDHAVGTIDAFMKKTGKEVYISFSGGKDSTVLLDIARRFIDKDVEAVFCNTGNEYPEIVKFVRTIDNVTIIHPKIKIPHLLEKYGFPLISKEESQKIRQAQTTSSSYLRDVRLHGRVYKGRVYGKISEKYLYLVDEPFRISEQCCEWLKKKPFRQYEKESGKLPVIGITISESRLRFKQYVRRGGCNLFGEKKQASFPISIFTDKDIYEYINRFNLPICELYHKGYERTGCMFCGFGAHIDNRRFSLLYEHNPKLYYTMMGYTNNKVTYHDALLKAGVELPE